MRRRHEPDSTDTDLKGVFMSLQQVLMFNFVLLVAILSPGPAQLIAIKTSLSDGPKAGRQVGLGLALVAASWTLCGFFGLEIVFAIFPKAYWVVKTLGALYLIWLAWGMWCNAGQPITQLEKANQNAFLLGVGVNILNPKSVLFAASVIAVVFPTPVSTLEALALSANHLIIEIVFYSLLAHTMNLAAVRAFYDQVKRQFDRIAALVLGALALRLLLSLRES